MMHGWRLLVILFVCTLAGPAAYYITPPTPAIQPGLPPVESCLSIPESTLQLPTSWESQAFRWSVPVSNTSEVALQILAIRGSCNCVSITPQKATLQPGETLMVEMSINHTTKPKPDLSVNFGMTIIFQHPAYKKEVRSRWQFSGAVRRHLTGPHQVVLQHQSELTVPLLAWRFPIDSQEPLRDLTVDCDVPELTVSIESRDSTGCRFELVVTPPRTMKAREMQGRLTLRPTSRQAGILPTRTIPLEATVAPDASVEPLEMGPRLLGSMHEEPVAVTSLTNRKWHIESVKTHGEGLSAEIRAGQLYVRQAILLRGYQQNRVELLVSSEGHRQTVTFAVVYTGTAQD